MSMTPQQSASGTAALGWEEFLELPEDGNRYEILDGELVVTRPPAIRHQRVVLALTRILDGHIVRHGLGELFANPVAVRLAEKTIVEPDLLFIARERADIVAELSVNGAPDLVVEILSPSTAKRDRTVKAQLYARLGVSHYWLLDPQERRLQAFALDGGEYRCAIVLDGNAPFEPSLFPGLVIDLGSVWA